MGMDPLKNDEVYEVTIVLQGPLKKAEFRLFRAEVDKLIDACAGIADGITTGKKLQVRESRGGVRKQA